MASTSPTSNAATTPSATASHDSPTSSSSSSGPSRTTRHQVRARRASIAVCRRHTDLTCPTIAAIHGTADAQPAFSRATVARYRREDPAFDLRYRQLLDDAEQARRTAGFADANLMRGVTSERPARQLVPN